MFKIPALRDWGITNSRTYISDVLRLDCLCTYWGIILVGFVSPFSNLWHMFLCSHRRQLSESNFRESDLISYVTIWVKILKFFENQVQSQFRVWNKSKSTNTNATAWIKHKPVTDPKKSWIEVPSIPSSARSIRRFIKIRSITFRI